MSFVEHLAELRLRLRNSAIVFLVAIGFSFYFVKNYFDLLTRPARAAWVIALSGQEPVFRFASPTEPFWVYTKLAMYGALLRRQPVHLLGDLEVHRAGALQERKADGAGGDLRDRRLLHRRRALWLRRPLQRRR